MSGGREKKKGRRPAGDKGIAKKRKENLAVKKI